MNREIIPQVEAKQGVGVAVRANSIAPERILPFVGHPFTEKIAEIHLRLFHI